MEATILVLGAVVFVFGIVSVLYGTFGRKERRHHSQSEEVMGRVLSINGLAVPDDFPADQFEAVYTKLGSTYGGRDEYRVFIIGALNAIAYRFTALAEYDESFRALIAAHGTGPGQPFRHRQERDLFGFFSNVFSVFEALCFALFAIGALSTASAKFPLATNDDERKVSWGKMRETYRSAFPADPILNVLDNIAKDFAFEELRDIRNILTHRAVGARSFEVSAGSSTRPETTTIDRLNISLDATTTASRRRDVVRLLLLGLNATHKFAEARL